MALTDLRHPVLGALLGLGAGTALLATAGESMALPVLLFVALAGLGSMVWFKGSLRRYFLVLLFFVAPFDLSKAVVPPLDRFHSPGWYMSLGHLALLALCVAWGIERLLVRKVPLQRTRLDTLAFIYLAWIWCSAAMAPGDKVLLLASAFSYSLCVLAFYVVSHAIEHIDEVRRLMQVVVVGLLLQVAHVGAQMLTRSHLPLPGSKGAGTANAGNVVNFGGQEAAAFRPTGAFDHPNALADYLTLVGIPALALVLMGPQRIPRRTWWVALGVFGLCSVTLLISLSRGGWAAMALGCLAVAVVFWRHRLIGSTHVLGAVLAGSVALGAVLAAYPQVIWRLTEPDDRSLESRTILNDQALAIVAEHPLTGAGFGAYNRAAHEVHGEKWGSISSDYQQQILKLVVHNHYLLVAAQLGIPALLFWCYLLWRMARQAWPVQRWRDPGTTALAVGLGGALISQMLFLASDNYDADIRVFMLWLTAGLLQALVRLRPWPAQPGLAKPGGTA
jgi:O-antigen ligase